MCGGFARTIQQAHGAELTSLAPADDDALPPRLRSRGRRLVWGMAGREFGGKIALLIRKPARRPTTRSFAASTRVEITIKEQMTRAVLNSADRR